MKDLDDFAIAALQGMLACPGTTTKPKENETWQQAIARESFDIAEAMQCESKKRREQDTDAPIAADQGWIDWHGGECPVQGGSRVNIRFRNGTTNTVFADHMLWDHAAGPGDIVAYRVLK